MKNTLLNMVLVLGGITFVCSAAVALVYRVTAEPIALARLAGTQAAIGNVLPDFERSTSQVVQINGMDLTVHTAVNRSGEVVGYAVETVTKRGFSGEIRMMVGFTADSRVYSVEILEHAETPGLGDKIKNSDNPLFNSFAGRNPSEMRLAVTKDGGDVDILTAATITSRAYVDAVARAFNALMQATGGKGVDAVTSATPVDGATGATDSVADTTGVAGTDASSGATPKADATTGGTVKAGSDSTKIEKQGRGNRDRENRREGGRR